MQSRRRATAPRLNPLALCLLGSGTLLAFAPAWAQTAAPASSQTQTSAKAGLETVVVTGFRASLESALSKKRTDNGIVDAITSEDIAKFPDTNLAESLQRIPGVVIDRDAGEGRSITVRGLGSDFTRVRINGIEALATTGGADSSGGNNRGRGFDFNVFASELFNSVTVRKSASADVEEGSLGATVDLSTTRPFDLKGFVSSVSVQGRYNDLSGKTDPRLAFLVSNTFADRKLGALVSVAYSKRNLYEDLFGTGRWDNGPSSGGWCAPTGVAANPAGSTTHCGPVAQGVPRVSGTPDNIAAYNLASSPENFHPRLPRYGRLTHEQSRLGVTASFQFKPADSTVASLDLMYAKLDATRQEDYLSTFSFSRSLSGGGKPQVTVLETQYAPNGSLLYGRYNGVDVRAESRYDELSTEYTQPTLTLEHSFSDSIKLSARAGRAQSKFRNPIQTTTTLDAANVNGYTIDFRGNSRLPVISYPIDVTQPGGAMTLIGVPRVSSGTQPSSIANSLPSEIRIRPQGSTNINDVAQLNLSWDLMPDSLTLRAGTDYKRYSFDTYEFRRVNQGDTIFAPPAGTSVADLSMIRNLSGSSLGIPAGTPSSWVIPNLPAIVAAYDIYCNCIKSGPAGGPGDFTLSSITNGNARGNNRSAEETSTGAWLMADFDTKLMDIPLRGNVGLRYVKTDLKSVGYVATGGGTEVVVEHSYKDVLPSLNLAANLSRDLILRAGAAKVMARPQLGNLSPGGSINTTGQLSISTGNPFLKPFRAKTFDTSIEWYHDKTAFVGLGLFYKKIDTYIQSLRNSIPFNQTGLPQSLLPTNFTGNEIFQVTTPINTNGGNLSGFELNIQQPFTFLPGWGRNFGALFNYTHVKSKIDYLVAPTSTAVIRDDLLNLSPKSANATLYYDDGQFSARVSASRRSAFLTRVPGQNNNDVEGKNGSTYVDMSISYKLNDRLEFTLQGVNLTNEASDFFVSRARNDVVSYNVTGREFLFGARYKF